jgi:hypothetical protein
VLDNTSPDGVRIRWGISHRDADGRLIVRHVMVSAPPAVSGGNLSARWRYFAKIQLCSLLRLYHRKRVAYAETNKDRSIPEHYRSGQPAPRDICQALKELCRLEIRRILPNGPDTKHYQ